MGSNARREHHQSQLAWDPDLEEASEQPPHMILLDPSFWSTAGAAGGSQPPNNLRALLAVLASIRSAFKNSAIRSSVYCSLNRAFRRLTTC